MSLMESATVVLTNAVHVTVIAQDCPAARLAGHVFVCEKSPEIEIFVIFNGGFPVFVSVVAPDW